MPSGLRSMYSVLFYVRFCFYRESLYRSPTLKWGRFLRMFGISCFSEVSWPLQRHSNRCLIQQCRQAVNAYMLSFVFSYSCDYIYVPCAKG